MEKLNNGDLVVILPKVEKIRAVLGILEAGMIGVIVDHSAKFNDAIVYGVMIDGSLYYLFEDEIEKLEEKC